jgi:hypothetical protein
MVRLLDITVTGVKNIGLCFVDIVELHLPSPQPVHNTIQIVLQHVVTVVILDSCKKLCVVCKNFRTVFWIAASKSIIYTRNSMGPSTEPWRTPDVTFLQDDL